MTRRSKDLIGKKRKDRPSVITPPSRKEEYEDNIFARETDLSTPQVPCGFAHAFLGEQRFQYADQTKKKEEDETGTLS